MVNYSIVNVQMMRTNATIRYNNAQSTSENTELSNTKSEALCLCSITNSTGPVQSKLHQMADQALAQDSSVSRVLYVESVFVNIKMKYHKPIKAMYVVIYYICEIWQQ
jgi:hypothetical protein